MKRYAIVAAVNPRRSMRQQQPVAPSNDSPNTLFYRRADAANEVPPITNADATAAATATITLNLTRDTARDDYRGQGRTSSTASAVFPAGTQSILAHIHEGGPAIPGGPDRLRPDGGQRDPLAERDANNITFSNIANYPDECRSTIIDNPNGYYFNVHYGFEPAGRVRGQLVKQ